MSFKRSASLTTGVLASLVWRLCCHSPFCHGNYIDDIVFLGWVWYMLFTHTQLLKEMSAGLYRRWWQTLWWVPPHRLGEINEFLEDTFSNVFSPYVPPSSLHIFLTCFCSYLFTFLSFALLLDFCSFSLLPLIAIPSSLVLSRPNTLTLTLTPFFLPWFNSRFYCSMTNKIKDTIILVIAYLKPPYYVLYVYEKNKYGWLPYLVWMAAVISFSICRPYH